MKNYFQQLVGLMEAIDNNKALFEEDDTRVPEVVMAEFDGNNEFYVDVRTLKEMLEVTFAIPDFLKGIEHIPLKGAVLHNERIKELVERYDSLYLPLLQQHGQGTTLRK